MKPVSRRGILRLLPAVPMAAGALASQAKALTGAAVLGDVNAPPMALPGASIPCDVGSGSMQLQGSALSRFLKRLGLPGFKRREIRRQARYSRQIDPDLAALRSVSLSAMLHIQWRRNEARIEAEMYGYWNDEEERQDFMRRHTTGWF